MTAEEYLKQYRDAVIIANRLKTEYDKEWELLNSIRSPLGSDGMPRGGGISKQVEQKAIRLAEKLEKWHDAEIEASLIKTVVMDTVNKVPGNCGEVLYERYINLLKWEQVADKLGYSERQCHNLKDKGLEIVEKLIR